MKNKRSSAHPAGRGKRPDRRQSKPQRPAGQDASHDRTALPLGDAGDAEANSGERIAKRLARVGVASRRDAEVMIAEGRVRVNGKVLTSPALNITGRDRIEVDGEPLAEVERTRLFLFHKPGGVVTTSRDPEGRKTIFEILPKGLPRLISVGRLDINTEGLILLTNDGGLARVLELPTTGWLRRYRVRVHGQVEQSQLTELEKGIAVDGVFYGSIEATLDRVQGTNSWLTVSFREGKNREVKNVLSALGLLVTRLIRISFGPFQLGDLPEGAVQEVKGRTLRDQLGERLIEEAGANFDAPVAFPFANGPVRAGQERKTQVTEKKKERSTVERGPVNRKKAQESHREDMRDRLQTKPPQRGRDDGKSERPFRERRSEGSDRFGGEKRFGDKRSSEGGRFDRPKSGGRDRDGRSEDLTRSRTAHVWMAPGARPVTRKPVEEGDDRSDRRTERSRSGPPRHRDDDRGASRSNDRPRNDRPRNERTGGGRPGGPSKRRPSGKG